MNTHLITDCFGIDGRVVAPCLGVVETPDTTSDATTIVNKPVMIMNPHCNNMSLEPNEFIRVTLWCDVWKFNHCGLGTARRVLGL